MFTLENLRHDKKAAILNLARLHGARAIRVYGSVARGQATEQSDLDLLVEWEPDRSLLDVIGLKQDLEDLLGLDHDVAHGPLRRVHLAADDPNRGARHFHLGDLPAAVAAEADGTRVALAAAQRVDEQLDRVGVGRPGLGRFAQPRRLPHAPALDPGLRRDDER